MSGEGKGGGRRGGHTPRAAGLGRKMSDEAKAVSTAARVIVFLAVVIYR